MIQETPTGTDREFVRFLCKSRQIYGQVKVMCVDIMIQIQYHSKLPYFVQYRIVIRNRMWSCQLVNNLIKSPNPETKSHLKFQTSLISSKFLSQYAHYTVPEGPNSPVILNAPPPLTPSILSLKRNACGVVADNGIRGVTKSSLLCPLDEGSVNE